MNVELVCNILTVQRSVLSSLRKIRYAVSNELIAHSFLATVSDELIAHSFFATVSTVSDEPIVHSFFENVSDELIAHSHSF